MERDLGLDAPSATGSFGNDPSAHQFRPLPHPHQAEPVVRGRHRARSSALPGPVDHPQEGTLPFYSQFDRDVGAGRVSSGVRQ
jgi:hypothetical protein